MQYKNTQKILVDKRKLEILLRLNCPKENIYEAIVNNKIIYTNDELIDDNLETLVDFKVFENWGGARSGAGRKPNKNNKKNQDEFHLENQDVNQDINQVVDIDIDKDKDKDKDKDFIIPSFKEIKDYCAKRKNNINPLSFLNYYTSKGWMIGKNKMKDWKAAVRTWEQKEKNKFNQKDKIQEIVRRTLNEQK